MRENNFKRLPVILNNKIVGIITQTDLSRTIDAFSDAVEEMAKFYDESKTSIEKIIDEWGNMLYELKGHKKLTEHRQLDVIKDEMEREN
jgi:signal-transduction protein with cAMP-binding, CBS, and nucleotidyltransferase domain